MKKISPKGIARHAWLTKPDTKYDVHGYFSCDLVVNPEDSEVQDFKGDLEAIRDENFQACLAGGVKNSMTKEQLKKLHIQEVCSHNLDNEGDQTGALYFRFKIPALPYSRDLSQCSTVIRKPAQYDESGHRLKPEEEYDLIPNGSTIRVGCMVEPYVHRIPGVGVRLQLLAVQVCKLAVLPQDTPFDFPAD